MPLGIYMTDLAMTGDQIHSTEPGSVGRSIPHLDLSTPRGALQYCAKRHVGSARVVGFLTDRDAVLLD